MAKTDPASSSPPLAPDPAPTALPGLPGFQQSSDAGAQAIAFAVNTGIANASAIAAVKSMSPTDIAKCIGEASAAASTALDPRAWDARPFLLARFPEPRSITTEHRYTVG